MTAPQRKSGGRPYLFTEDEERRIIERYVSGEGSTKLARELHTNRQTLKNIFDRWGVRPLRTKVDGHYRKITPELGAEARRLYEEEQLTLAEVGQRLGFSVSGEVIKRAGGRSRSASMAQRLRRTIHPTPPGKWTAERVAPIARAYAAGVPVWRIARRFDIGATLVPLILRKHGHRSRTAKEAAREREAWKRKPRMERVVTLVRSLR